MILTRMRVLPLGELSVAGWRLEAAVEGVSVVSGFFSERREKLIDRGLGGTIMRIPRW